MLAIREHASRSLHDAQVRQRRKFSRSPPVPHRAASEVLPAYCHQALDTQPWTNLANPPRPALPLFLLCITVDSVLQIAPCFYYGMHPIYRQPSIYFTILTSKSVTIRFLLCLYYLSFYYVHWFWFLNSWFQLALLCFNSHLPRGDNESMYISIHLSI